MSAQTTEKVKILLNFNLLTNLTHFFFHMDDLDRDRIPLTDNERRMIFTTHQYFFDVRQRQNQRQTLTLRKQVVTVLGIEETTVGRVVAEQNKRISSSKKI